ncbi:hypothetical protein AB3S75_012794 [Citrus x aurantiifolia]
MWVTSVSFESFGLCIVRLGDVALDVRHRMTSIPVGPGASRHPVDLPGATKSIRSGNHTKQSTESNDREQ